MANVDYNLIVKHLVNGSFSSNLCLICLTKLEENKCESIFTRICKEDKDYCIADVLEAVCQIKLGTENYNICTDCFYLASTAYKFYLQTKRSHEILNGYTDELLSNLEHIDINEKTSDKILFLPLPVIKPATELFDYDFNIDSFRIVNSEFSDSKSDSEYLVCVENDEKITFQLIEDGSLLELENVSEETVEKVRKKRDPMSYISCSKCPIKYRFVAKFKEHMKSVHNIDIYYCKICKITIEDKHEYEKHLQSHEGEHQCTICNAIYKKRETLVAHLKNHEKNTMEQSQKSNICEVCGILLQDEESLKEHANKHIKRYTCYYCGRMYKGEASFEAHIKKHENNTKNTDKKPTQTNNSNKKSDLSKRSMCNICNKSFVDERSLLWHQRLHNNEKPYTCKVCGARFVCPTRRNQHWVCAHSPPARRCPLCPALFHLKSMVNTHLKKVHLKTHKRRINRTTKYKNVYWKTETVPIQDLSVSIQNDILELKTMQENSLDTIAKRELMEIIEE